jgi:Na+/proline symporter/signal transduction histidine kinase
VFSWLSLDTWLVTFLSIAYLALLFVVAHWGQNQAKNKWHSRPWIYSLSLGVSCTSWAFYGTVGQAVTTGAWLAPVYIGSILCFVLAWPMLIKMLQITKQQNLTSIADFIACRYDRSPKIAAIIALIALVGTIPYIALQLRAISKSFDLLTGTFESGISTAFVVTLVLIIFSILFGTRQIAASKQNQGLVLAIAFSSIVKLFALSAVGIFATFFIFDGFSDLYSQHAVVATQVTTNTSYLAISQAILGAITIFILPQQFHMIMIENHHQQELKTARWLYPIYLILINVFVLPIAIAGQLTFPGGSVDADTYVLTIPLFYQQAWLGVVVYIGGLAAATSMVIVAAIVLSTMISTEILNPTILHFRLFNSKQTPQLSGLLLNLRRFAITIILLLAFAFERLINQQNHLASIGLLSFVLLAQFAPAAIGALYWRKATSNAAFSGLIIGSLVWLYTLLLPTLMPTANWVNTGLFNINYLIPNALLGLSFLDPVSHGVFYSLSANLACYVLISWFSHRSVGEKLQAELFLNKKTSRLERHLSLTDLTRLLQRFINQKAADGLLTYAQQAGNNHQALVDHTRLQLSGVLGSASTRMVMKAAAFAQDTSEKLPLEDVISIVDEASQLFEFNRELLQAGVENIEQGISVVDADMRLVAWNQRYIKLLDYPDGLVTVGKPIAELLSYNANRGVITGDNNQTIIARRLEHMRRGNSHHFQREMPSGIVLEIRGQAMPGGGFVSTFSDITAHIEAERALQKANENLEKRVATRTQELAKAKADAEAANQSKTRFLAAASHDLMQPFNALTLFTSVLSQQTQGTELETITNNISDSLVAAEALLSDLVEISKLDSGYYQLHKSTFAINDLLVPLQQEFSALAATKNIDFHFKNSRCFINSDKKLLRRIVQNFLSNAFNYCHQDQRSSKVLCGVKRAGDFLSIEVWDNGSGIAKDKQQLIFKEFERLNNNQEQPGLGLGLAICERIAKLLNTPITLNSQLGKGTCFSVKVPLVTGTLTTKINNQCKMAKNIFTDKNSNNQGTILVVDNDPLVLKAMHSLLTNWGFTVLIANNAQSVKQLFTEKTTSLNLIIADYHLDDNNNGVDLVLQFLTEQQWSVPCIVNSADPSERVRQHTSDAHFYFIPKPIKSIALKRLIRKLITANELT